MTSSPVRGRDVGLPPSIIRARRFYRDGRYDVKSFSFEGSGRNPRINSSPSAELTARKDFFSRRQYGSVEMLHSSQAENCERNGQRFRMEAGEREGDELASPVLSPIHLENPEFHTRWYFKYFLGKLHHTYVGVDLEPFLLSVVITDANNHNTPQYRAILWRKRGNQKICLPYNPNKPLNVKNILCNFELDKIEKGPKEILNAEIQKDLLVLEEQEGSVNFKFGVLFCREGQTSDDEMYSNKNGSSGFSKLCTLLGDRIQLNGWEKFRGGLDNKSDTTGTESVYTMYEGHEIMFHVSTLLPHSDDNRQQVERKRHVGNDIVNIVYVENEYSDEDFIPSFRPSMMKTHFTHIYAVVVYYSFSNSYRLWVFSAESVPLFGPALPCPAVFFDHQEFRDFLLVKLINGEKAAFNTPVFAQKRIRTLEMLITNLYQDHMPDKVNPMARRACGDAIVEQSGGASSRRKEDRKGEMRQADFLRIGQSLKLKTILRGDAPTSLISSFPSLRQQPWQPQLFSSEVHADVICGDSWADNLLVVTASGTYLLSENSVPRMLFDRSVAIKQLDVNDTHGILVFRADKGRDSGVNVFRLSDFDGDSGERAAVRCKSDVREHRLDASKGCHLYALSRTASVNLRMVVCINKRLLVCVWKYSPSWSLWCVMSDADIVDGFQVVQELSCHEVPSHVTLIDGLASHNNICIAYRSQFDLLNEKNGDCLQLHQIPSSKVNIVSALDIYEDDEPELLLTYNRTSHFQKLSEETSSKFDFHWNSEPIKIVCAFPYVLAFTSETIEIRLIINGNLVHTMAMPDLNMITAKCDIFFSSTIQDQAIGGNSSGKSSTSTSSPPSPACTISVSGPQNMRSIFRISLVGLVGQPVTPSRPKEESLGASSSPGAVESPRRVNISRSPVLGQRQNRSTLAAPRLIHSASTDSAGLVTDPSRRCGSQTRGVLRQRSGKESPLLSSTHASSFDSADETSIEQMQVYAQSSSPILCLSQSPRQARKPLKKSDAVDIKSHAANTPQ